MANKEREIKIKPLTKKELKDFKSHGQKIQKELEKIQKINEESFSSHSGNEIYREK